MKRISILIYAFGAIFASLSLDAKAAQDSNQPRDGKLSPGYFKIESSSVTPGSAEYVAVMYIQACQAGDMA
jgi:hypothetical protein